MNLNKYAITLICSNTCCLKQFKRNKGEVNRNARLSRPVFCSLKCSGFRNAKNLTNRNTSHLRNINRRDKYSGLREHLNRAKKRKGKDCTISLDDLLEIWDKQEGRCVYTGVTLIHPIDCTDKTSKSHKASLDRIDSSIGYIKENIQFISALANYAKNDISHKEMLVFCATIANHYTDRGLI